MKVIAMSVGLLGANSYIIYHDVTGEAVVIDPGGDGQTIFNKIRSNQLKAKYILLTHGHFDHIDAVGWLKEKIGAKVAIHRKDASFLEDSYKNLSFSMGIESIQPKVDIILEHGNSIDIGDLVLRIIHTPGHSPGSISIICKDLVFTGDTLFKGSIGRTDLPGGNLRQSLPQ